MGACDKATRRMIRLVDRMRVAASQSQEHSSRDTLQAIKYENQDFGVHQDEKKSRRHAAQ